MKKELVFATHNAHKAQEIQAILGEDYSLKTLNDIGLTQEIPENENTLEGNALAKAQYVKSHFGLDCFADDTGLLVDALNGEPGVYSARYAGLEKSSEANMAKLLKELENKANRKAHFKTVIALNFNNKEILFEGVCLGEIATEKRGEKGFGYDPIFIPEGFTKSFAEMTMDEKATISHRGLAVQKLVDFLQSR